MAAGIGSRFGTGIKQLEPVDASNHIIMDYSLHDAIEAGFNHVVFIIRKDIEKEFKEVIGDRIASICVAHNVTVPENPLKAEYLIPIFIGELLSEGKMSVKVLKTNDTWYGMTYHEDVAAVKDSFQKMLENGVYKADLFSDL